MKRSPLAAVEPLAYPAFRIVVGLLFLCHGLQKVGLFGGPRVNPLSLLGAAAVIETVGGVLTVIGLFTVPTAIVCSGEMAVAYVRAHSPQGPLPILNGGELALLYAFAFLFIATRGGGRFSVDRG